MAIAVRYFDITFSKDKDKAFVTLSQNGATAKTYPIEHKSRDGSRFVIIDAVTSNVPGNGPVTRKRKFNQDTVEPLVVELEAYLKCGAITKQEYDSYFATRYEVSCGNEVYYGMDMPYFPGKSLAKMVDAELRKESSKEDKIQNILKMHQGVLEAYGRLGVLTGDYSPGNVIWDVNKETWTPIDYGDHLPRYGDPCGKQNFCSKTDPYVDRLFDSNWRVRYNHRFFLSFHHFLVKALKAVDQPDNQPDNQALVRLRDSFSHDSISNNRSHRSTEALFEYHAGLLDQLVGNPTEDNLGGVRDQIWRKILNYKRRLAEVADRLNEHPSLEALVAKIRSFTEKIAESNRPDSFEAGKLLNEGGKLIYELRKNQGMRKHRNTISTMGQVNKGLLIGSCFLLVGLVVLLGLWIVENSPTVKELLVRRIVRACNVARVDLLRDRIKEKKGRGLSVIEAPAGAPPPAQDEEPISSNRSQL